ncbi:MAG TPA: tetratricopeptide repeat protein [Moraxellaceae bacterium]|nr:tetratricopeptide repeat protein [Moraxellaceae bacterium]
MLTAEFAALRQHPDIALDNYVAAARDTRDPGVVARATTIAQILNQPQSLEMAQLWTEVAPKAPEGWFLLALNALRQRQFETAIPAIDRLLDIQPEADLEQLFIAAQPSAQADRDELASRLDDLARTHPDNANLLFGQALVRAQSGKPAEALAIVSRAHDLRPDSLPVTLLQAKMLTELSRSREAANLLRRALPRHPDSPTLHLNLARALIRAGDLTGAEDEFRTMLQRQPDDANLHLSLALVAFDNHHDDVAEHELEHLQGDDSFGDEASYYLGLLAVRQNRSDDALRAFENVQPGAQYLPALAEISRLLSARGETTEARQRLAQARAQTPELATSLYQLEAELMSENGDAAGAYDLLTTALTELPGNPQLLLSRAMTAEQLNRLDAFESDVREVLKHDPDNASALNALGYTLADRTDRLDEAEKLIRRAHDLKPDDPAIIDSLGWVKYRRGDRKGALVELRKAYALFPDDEVAAHLGEVLWMLGQHDEARRIWTEALRQHPRSQHIPRTRARLDPAL